MDPVGAPLSNDVHNNPTHRQSILGSFLRVRPRGTSQSHQNPGSFGLQIDHDNASASSPQQALSDHALAVNITNGSNNGTNNANNMPIQPPSPGGAVGYRRRPAAGGTGGALQPSNSGAAHTFGLSISPSSSANVSMHGFSQILRRRRSANGALNSSSANPSTNSPIDANAPTSALPVRNNGAQSGVHAPPPSNAPPNPNARSHRIRLVPHLDSTRSLHFEPICRDVREGDLALRIGRFTDRSGMGVAALNAQNTNKLAFKSKVVSRAHAEVWCEPGGKFYIRDTKSSSGTFLNHIRLSAPNTDSKPFPIKDGDVLQLGVDYQGGTEEIYKCVKMRIELGREWQSQPNAFNTNALKQLKALSTQPFTNQPGTGPKVSLAKSGIPDCCICLFGVTVHQALFIAPCSHVFHYKCIRPMLLMHHPGFSCPLCRTFANLEEDVEIDIEDQDMGQDVDTEGGSGGSSGENVGPVVLPGTAGTTASARANAMEVDAPVNMTATPSVANDVAAGGAETEVERDYAPYSVRRRNNNTNFTNGNAIPNANPHDPRFSSHSVSPVREIEGVPEDADEYLSAASDDYNIQHFDFDHEETDDVYPLPALPVPTPSGALPVPSNISSSAFGQSSNPAASAPGQMQGMAIQRPMSVPIQSPSAVQTLQAQAQQERGGGFRRMSPLDDAMSDEDGDGDGEGEDDLNSAVRRAMGASIGMTVGGGDGNASGSSAGEGAGGGLLGGVGEKRKR
ncbi:hypothetical protein ACEPAF_5977 [Sanghuangporus sanghuang]